jgi:hypothetical protein
VKHDFTHIIEPGPPPGAAHRTRLRRAAFVVAALAAVAAGGGGGGRGGPGVAGAGTTSTTSASASNQSAQRSPIAFSKCMRAHGVTKFPDPQADGGLTLQAGPGTGIDPNGAVFRAAQKACEAMMPKPSAAEQQKAQAQALKYSQCMRAHGISDFPDPSSGGLNIEMKPGSDLDPNSPAFKTAQKACEKENPGGPHMQSGGPANGSSGRGPKGGISSGVSGK